MKTRFYAYCYANGSVRFGSNVPKGAIPLCSYFCTKHGRKKFRDDVNTLLRRPYLSKSIYGLIPGIPEAPDQKTAGDALKAFFKWAKPIWRKQGYDV